MSSILHLMIPGLLSCLSESPATPALRRWIKRGQRRAWPHALEDATLFELFGLPTDAPLPVAPLTWLHDGGDAGSAAWLRADPVYLRADAGSLILFDTARLDLAEAEQLGAALQQFWREEGLELLIPTPSRWYLRLPELPQADFVPPHRAWGQDIFSHLPQGAAGRQWRRLGNDAQMLLHDHPANLAREQRGEWPINSVWLWGAGRLPALAPKMLRVYSHDPLAGGLARLAGQAALPLPGDADQLEPGGAVVCLLPRPQEMDDLAALEQDWLAPLLDALAARTWDELRLYAGQGSVFALDRAALRRWWRW
jgi:hypothetical protein